MQKTKSNKNVLSPNSKKITSYNAAIISSDRWRLLIYLSSLDLYVYESSPDFLAVSSIFFFISKYYAFRFFFSASVILELMLYLSKILSWWYIISITLFTESSWITSSSTFLYELALTHAVVTKKKIILNLRQYAVPIIKSQQVILLLSLDLLVEISESFVI